MKAYFKGKLINEEKIPIGIHNRQFLYGDGFFETMLARHGKVKYQRYHIERVQSAVAALNISPPAELHDETLARIISQLFENNPIKEFAKVKIHVWRANGGTYRPNVDQGELLVSISSLSHANILTKPHTAFSQKVKNHFSSISKFKSSSALNYVMAGVEMRDRMLDDIIIPDEKGSVSECLVSNLFWVKGGKIFTPSLKTGCVSGIGRRVLMEFLKTQSYEITEANAAKEELLDADHVFTTNALGLSHILGIEGKTFSPFREIEKFFSLY